tara:strand:- start:868 stop:1749 length:882 start_codon:yes stop_codon:yes gene_type:complete
MPKIQVFDYLKLNQYVNSNDFNQFYPLKVNNEDGFNRYILTNSDRIILLKSNMTLYNSSYSKSNNYVVDPDYLKVYFDKNFKNDSKFINAVNAFCDKIKLIIYEKYKICISNNILTDEKSTDEYYFESKMITGETMLKSTRIIFNNYDGFKVVIPPDIHSIEKITQKKWINCIFYFLPIIYSKNDKYRFVNKTLNINLYENPSLNINGSENILSNYEDDLIKNNIINSPTNDNSLENNLTTYSDSKIFDEEGKEYLFDFGDYDLSLIEPASHFKLVNDINFTQEEKEFLSGLF